MLAQTPSALEAGLGERETPPSADSKLAPPLRGSGLAHVNEGTALQVLQSNLFAQGSSFPGSVG